MPNRSLAPTASRAQSPRGQRRQPIPTRVSSAAALAAPVLLIALDLLDGATRPGYDLARHWVSHLSLGERGWLGTLKLLVCGVLATAAALGVRAAVADRAGRWGARFLAVAGAGLVTCGIFPIDPGLDYPVGTSGGYTWHGHIHDVAGFVVFAGLAAACALLGRTLRGEARWAWTGQLAAVTVAVAFVTCSVLVSLDFAGALPHAPSGLFERISLFTGLSWAGPTAAWLLRRETATAATDGPAISGDRAISGGSPSEPGRSDT